jgi:hypothetical protein
MEEYGKAGQCTDDNVGQSTRIACWIKKPTDTHCSYFLALYHGLIVTFYVHCPFLYLCPMTAYSFIVTLVTLQKTRSARAECDATFGALHCQLGHIVC